MTCPAGRNKYFRAVFIVGQYLSNNPAGVHLSIWYDWKNGSTVPKEPEHFFGTVNHQLTPKPAYEAVADVLWRLPVVGPALAPAVR